jgi:hypothetical protein
MSRTITTGAFRTYEELFGRIIGGKLTFEKLMNEEAIAKIVSPRADRKCFLIDLLDQFMAIATYLSGNKRYDVSYADSQMRLQRMERVSNEGKLGSLLRNFNRFIDSPEKSKKALQEIKKIKKQAERN